MEITVLRLFDAKMSLFRDFLCYHGLMERLIKKDLARWRVDPNKKPLILDGARQVGKTFIISEFAKNFGNFHAFNFEKKPEISAIFERDLDPVRIVRELALFQNKTIDLDNDLIFFDEIQECPQALTSLKYFCEDLQKASVCSAGSLLGVHLTPRSFPVGKVDMLRLWPMNFIEFLMALGEDMILEAMHGAKDEFPNVLHDKLFNLLKHYLVVGGLPEVVQIYVHKKSDYVTAFANVRLKQGELYNAYVADMAKHSGKVNSMHLERLFRSIPEQLSKEQDKEVSKFRFRGVIPQVKEYSRLVGAIDWLQKAGLIIKVQIANQGLLPFSAYCKENLFKLYLFDVGLLGALSNLSPQAILEYDYGSYKGYFAENFVTQEFIARGLGPLYAWREGTAELEFLLEENAKVVPVEVKAGNTAKAKSLKEFSRKYHPPRQVKITGRPLQISNDKKVYNYPLYFAGLAFE